ncbi:hypothetical protein ASPWEDRAFT_170981 [Aspergillus wentii DTO 134E9]|uniref:Sister chromatid cohesion protein Dcc1 n=1 Tax=Aspergillus wentii DTO 134E9 TaxID=1073089 RepID=A0A1L9RRC3_ASPWE|nr:uncharacterized protein ASPWEDRAFT_170981 [Aspergillus wentii DTO 134E9]KAI9930355.1 hypothetical protein MW887_011108 [Aspergillus wentii]OJJ37510.1 hypothetical protein ASPWEDRAFT_170981 [Aspergillus wentii DTO 134E9]
MSTQAARSILFTHTNPQQGFRLLELPSEVVELLSSKEPPTLQLKSPSMSQSQSTTDPTAPEYVNLCTPTQTFRIRQVHSSNSIHMIRPSEGAIQKDDIKVVGEDEDMNLVETVTTIAKCGSTLELHTPPEGFSAIPFLGKVLRVYDTLSTEADDDVIMNNDIHELADRKRVIDAVFDDVPVSRNLCEKGWVELCAFVFGQDGSGCCWRPSSRVKVDVWKRMVEGAVLQGINLETQFLANDLWKSVLDDAEEPFPQPLFEAILRRVCESEDDQTQLSVDENLKWASIDKTSCTRWVGETYLEAMAPTTKSAIGRSEFLNAWKDHLPESWRDEVALSKLPENSYQHPDPVSICFVNEVDREKVKKNLSADSSAATAAKKTRNWHELFKNQKRR